MTAFDIQNTLAMDCFDRGHVMTVPNNTTGILSEADLLSLTPTHFIHEFEIKLSKSDFRADFKNKHFKHQKFGQLLTQDEEEKKPYYCPNYYWFVMPENLLPLESIPDYAGLIYVKEREHKNLFGTLKVGLETVKRAPRLHSTKLEDKWIEKLHNTLKNRYWSLRIKGKVVEHD
jgi:hypothetical protein